MSVGLRLRSCQSPANKLNSRSEEHTSELQSQSNLVCRLLLEKKKRSSSFPQTLTSKCNPWREIFHHSEDAKFEGCRYLLTSQYERAPMLMTAVADYLRVATAT